MVFVCCLPYLSWLKASACKYSDRETQCLPLELSYLRPIPSQDHLAVPHCMGAAYHSIHLEDMTDLLIYRLLSLRVPDVGMTILGRQA